MISTERSNIFVSSSSSRLTNAMLSKLLGGLGHIQALQFTGMGGPMGVYENYDTYAPRPPTPPSACEG